MQESKYRAGVLVDFLGAGEATEPLPRILTRSCVMRTLDRQQRSCNESPPSLCHATMC